MTKQRRIRWKFGILAGLAVVLVTMIPQLSLWIDRGAEWHGAYAIVDPDELGYSAYLNSIINGRSRRNDPYSGGTATNHETLYSVQFFPPYALALVAKLFGLATPTVLIFFIPLFAFLSSLAVFWLLSDVTGDEKTASVGVLLVLLCGVLTSANPLIENNSYAVFSFLRRYVPGLAFPLFFVFCLCVWRASTRPGISSSLRSSIAAGAILVTLIFSYFYLWTTAGALLFVLAVLWLIFSKDARPRCLGVPAIIGGFAIAALIPYFQLLSQRSQIIDDHTLVLTRAPDLFRFTEIVGALLLTGIAFGVRKQRLTMRSPAVLFAASCAITPFVVLNQQVITGRSLQPFHYEQFTLSYLVLVSGVIIDALWWKQLTRRAILWVAFALVVGGSLAAKTTKVNAPQNRTTAAAIPLFAALETDTNSSTSRGYVVFDRTLLAAVAPTYTSTLHILWSPYMYTYGSISHQEDKERLFQYFYYLGVDEKKLEDLLKGNLYRAALFRLHRVNPILTQNFKPVTQDEIWAQISEYSKYKQQFSQKEVGQWPLSHLVLTADRKYDFSNLDRWYERDGGHQIGDSVIYRVRQRSQR
jgi:hypothetical protein